MIAGTVVNDQTLDNMNTKHYIEGLLPAWKALACDTELSSLVGSRDLSWVDERAKAEGLSFLTVTLPSLGKAVEHSFQSGRLVLPEGFKCVKAEARPVFLKKAFAVLFTEEGVLKCPDINPGTLIERDMYALAAKCIRQLTLLYYKYEVPYTTTQVQQTIDNFVRTEQEMIDMSDRISDLFQRVHYLENWEDYFRARVLTRARLLVHFVLGNYSPTDIEPKHGSGASACGTKPWERYKLPRYIPRMGKVFDYVELFFTGNSLADQLDEFLNQEEFEPVAKVALVPKDSRGPRMICEEPRETMYPQQGMMNTMYKAIDSRPGVRSMLSCVDQSRNKDLALFASESGEYSSLDCKDASDRISIPLVRGLFPRVWFEALMACRSEKAELPNGSIIELKGKFAPMGSACCFPVEAICFWALSLAVVLIQDEETAYEDRAIPEKGLPSLRVGDNRLDNPNSYERFTSHRKRLAKVVRRAWLPPGLNVRSKEPWLGKPLRDLLNWDKYETRVPVSVFGDDILVPTAAAPAVVRILEEVGLKINLHKSFTQGPFRESCGGDYFLGKDVSIVRLKKPIVPAPPLKRWEHGIASNLIKRKQDNLCSMFRTRDFVQNTISMYGDRYTLVESLRVWFKDLYAEELPIVSFPKQGDEQTAASGLFIRSMWGAAPTCVFTSLCPKCGTHITEGKDMEVWVTGGSRPIARLVCKHCNKTTPPPFREREYALGFMTIDRRCGLNRPIVYVRMECPVNKKIDNNDWCHVLRSLGNQGGLKGTSHVTLAKRNRYNLGWVSL